MAAPSLALRLGAMSEIVIALARKMFERARQDFLGPTHPMRVRARELETAYANRFLARPPEIAQCHFVDAYIRAYAAWHNYTGED